MSSSPIINGNQLANAPGGPVLLDLWQASPPAGRSSHA